MVSIKEKMQALKEQASVNAEEIKALNDACSNYKTENEALKADLEQAKADLESKDAEHAEALSDIKAELEEKGVALVDASEAIEQMKADMELAPVADASGGQKPVADGSVAADVDHEAELGKLATSAERIAYYRKHIENKG